MWQASKIKKMGWPHAPWGTPPERRGAKPKFDWDRVNWKLRDADIARQLGCSRERVRQVRMELGLPRPSKRKPPEALLKAAAAQLKRPSARIAKSSKSAPAERHRPGAPEKIVPVGNVGANILAARS